MNWQILVVIAGFLGSMGAVQAATPNPFQQGTQAPVLSQEERVSLLEYADNSKAKLEQALEDAKGLPFSQIQAIYLEVIKKVVIESAVSKPRSELLMRYALNQALELTYGIPTADGKGIAKAGILKDSANQNLLVQILEDSIDIALRYYQDDRRAIKEGNLLSLPYSKLAEERLTMARTKWLPAVLEWGFQYELSIGLLRQFLATIANEEQQRKAAFAEEILKADGWLSEQERNWPGSWAELQKRVRILRKNLRQLSLSTVKNFADQGALEPASYRIGAGEGFCLSLIGRSACDQSVKQQRWNLIREREGYFSIRNQTGSCMGTSKDWDDVHQYGCEFDKNQHFKIERVGKQFKIHPKTDEQYCLDYLVESSEQDPALRVRKCNGSDNQLFSFEKLPETEE